ncbi:MAG: GNAT family N-acetyltransferase [Flavobacteriaceae bacterium]|nr:MAG: GNAT family N-acetyltransferase [Flavobacteriaceae bacterium]
MISQLLLVFIIEYGEDHDFYNQFNGLDNIKYAIIAYVNNSNKPVGCGGFRKFNDESVELKRMYVKSSYRRFGIAGKILSSLEIWAKEKGFKKCIMETGNRQIEALKFYQKSGYQRIANYGPYTQISNSNCFEKIL